MRVIAVQPGFIGGVRRRAGDEFEIDESQFEQDIVGMPILPRWLHSADDPRGAKKRADEIKSRPWRGAIDASGQGGKR